jgi:SAM-dependent methyltransferase
VLDVRERQEAEARPILDAANIPFSELSDRSHELPPANTVIRIAAEPGLAAKTAEWLSQHGRRSESADFSYSTDPFVPARLWAPNKLVESAVTTEPPGRVLDLACGSGRDAVYLAAAGWNVVAVDILPDALDRGRLTAARFDCADQIEWTCADLRTFNPEGSFDLIVMAFFLDRFTIGRAAAALSSGGLLLLETFTPGHRALTGKPRSLALTLSGAEVPELLPDFDLLLCGEALRAEKHTIRVVARKR